VAKGAASAKSVAKGAASGKKGAAKGAAKKAAGKSVAKKGGPKKDGAIGKGAASGKKKRAKAGQPSKACMDRESCDAFIEAIAQEFPEFAKPVSETNPSVWPDYKKVIAHPDVCLLAILSDLRDGDYSMYTVKTGATKLDEVDYTAVKRDLVLVSSNCLTFYKSGEDICGRALEYSGKLDGFFETFRD